MHRTHGSPDIMDLALLSDCFVSVEIKVFCETNMNLKGLFEGWEKEIRCSNVKILHPALFEV